MIHSMTGYGKTIVQLPEKKITLEIRSLNSKNLDINTRMPSIYKEKELHVRKLISKTLNRGKVDFAIYSELTAEKTTTTINKPVIQAYLDQLKTITSANEVELLKMAVRFPDALNTQREEIDETEWSKIETAIQSAINNLIQYRISEGEILENDFKLRTHNIEQLLKAIASIDPERIHLVRERLQKGIDDIKEKYDENRFEQELLYYIEKYDITEEQVRLKNHLNYFLSTLETPESNGKKLGFIAQEMGREINTIGSKSNYAPMQKLVVQMKNELEKIKEQLLNVL